MTARPSLLEVARVVAQWIWQKIERFPVPAEEAVYVMAITGRDPTTLHVDQRNEQDHGNASPERR